MQTYLILSVVLVSFLLLSPAHSEKIDKIEPDSEVSEMFLNRDISEPSALLEQSGYWPEAYVRGLRSSNGKPTFIRFGKRASPSFIRFGRK